MPWSSVWAPIVRRSTAASPPTTIPVAAAVKQPARPALMPTMAATSAARAISWVFISLPEFGAGRGITHRVDRVAQAVDEQEMDFLDSGGAGMRNPQFEIIWPKHGG